MSFSDIIGHDREIGILKGAIVKDRVAHSFLFCGPGGIGKRMTAMAFARALNCSEVVDDSCGECSRCRRIEGGGDPNVMVVLPREAESKGGGVDMVSGVIRIGDIRDVQHRLAYGTDGGKKVCIVDGAEKMNTQAANAFLKTLEEPPKDTVIILIASQATALLPTILSRCQRINFSPLRREVVEGLVRERLGLSPERSRLIAALSGGSLGRALEGWDDALFEERKKLIEGLISLSSGDVMDVFTLADEVAREESISDVFEVMKLWYRDLALLREGCGEMVVNSDLADTLQRMGEGHTFDTIWESFQAIGQAEQDILPPRYGNKQLTLEVLFMDLATQSRRSARRVGQ
ncbi:MAG: DNA polymerase III subunit delta' [Deltaproteobacteria bacterium]|nr:DNA polymerase III subunit delta' [Deltaproteobacteria bacterium]